MRSGFGPQRRLWSFQSLVSAGHIGQDTYRQLRLEEDVRLLTIGPTIPNDFAYTASCRSYFVTPSLSANRLRLTPNRKQVEHLPCPLCNQDGVLRKRILHGSLTLNVVHKHRRKCTPARELRTELSALFFVAQCERVSHYSKETSESF